MAIINMRMLLTLLAPFILTLQMHTDMGDERGIRLAAALHLPRGRRPSGITDVGQGSMQQSLGTLFCQILSLDRSF